MEEERYEGKKMSYKSRKNWALGRGLSQERWDRIFGKKCVCDNGKICVGISLTEKPIYEECVVCKGIGRIK